MFTNCVNCQLNFVTYLFNFNEKNLYVKNKQWENYTCFFGIFMYEYSKKRLV